MTTEAMNSLVNEARKSKFSTIGQSLNDDDVLHIWNGVSEFIEKTMAQQKGVQVPGLGVFSFTQKKLEIGNNKHILIQRPVFMLSEKFAQTHGLTYTKYHSPGQIPIVTLNYTALSCASPYERDTIESCIREVLLALHRSIASKKNIEFAFTGIGRLHIRDGRVKMKFYKPFINMMDGSGSLADSMQNRPGTVDSVISDRCPSRQPTPNTLQLPRLAGPEARSVGDRCMPTIDEDAVDDPGAGAELDFQDTDRETEIEQIDDPAPRPQQVPIATLDDFALAQPASSRLGLSPLSKSSPAPLSDLPSVRTPLGDIKPASPLEPALKPPSPPAELRPVEKSLRWRPSVKSACGHHNAGQELCYLCHQREKLNVPVTFTEERAKRELEEDRLLQQYMEMKDTEASLKDEAENMCRRHENQKTAAFNLGVSEASKIKKHNRPTDFYPSYVFQKRPYTPPKYIKQGELNGELGKQVLDKRVKGEKQRADESFLERLEQVQLAEDLAAQRDRYLRDKHDQQEQYKRALSAQITIRENLPNLLNLPSRLITLSADQARVPRALLDANDDALRFKPVPLPAAEPDSAEPVFGKDDLTQEKLHERRRIAHELYKEQLSIAGQKKRDEILKRLAAQKNEEEVLKRNKNDLLRDRASRFDRMVRMRRHLEDNWSSALKTKVSRDSEDRRGAQSPGILLHEQCDRYNRCRNCKRNLTNVGESNIWCDTRYIPGSRLIV